MERARARERCRNIPLNHPSSAQLELQRTAPIIRGIELLARREQRAAVVHRDCIAGGRFAGAAYRGGCGVDLEGGGLGEDCLCCGKGEEQGEGEEHFVGWLVGWAGGCGGEVGERSGVVDCDF